MIDITTRAPFRGPRTKRSWVDRELRDALSGLMERIRQVEETGNIKTFDDGQRTRRRGYEQRDIVDDYRAGIEVDPRAEYVFNHSKLDRLRKRIRDRLEREYDAMTLAPTA